MRGVECAACGHAEAVRVALDSGDDHVNLQLVCARCRHSWAA
jgi:transcription elongation factor Elf1